MNSENDWNLHLGNLSQVWLEYMHENFVSQADYGNKIRGVYQVVSSNDYPDSLPSDILYSIIEKRRISN